MVMVKYSTAGARNIQEAHLTGQEMADGGLVGRIKDCSAGPAAPSDFIS
jgi:hypothetical protein